MDCCDPRGLYVFDASVSRWASWRGNYTWYFLPHLACCRHIYGRIREKKYWNGFWLSSKNGRGMLTRYLLNSGYESRPRILTILDCVRWSDKEVWFTSSAKQRKVWPYTLFWWLHLWSLGLVYGFVCLFWLLKSF